MAITFTNFKESFPEFQDLEESLFNARLADAQRMVNADVLGTKADLALKYLVAHLLTTFPEEGAEASGAQAVKRATVGGVSVEYATDAGTTTEGDTNDFSSTAYGRFYLKVIRSLGKTVTVL